MILTTRSAVAATLLCGLVVACKPKAETAPAPEAEMPFVAGFQPDSVLVRMKTTKGDIDVMLRKHWAPNGSQRAYETFATNYYDGARFFRSIRGFVVQFGIAADPTTTAAWRTRTIPDDTVKQSNRRGTLVFASGGPNTRTTQLFFNLRDNARLDSFGFPAIGEIVRGLDVLDSLYTGYGDGATAPAQDSITARGEAYLAEKFPLLDKIERAYVVRTWPARTPTATASPTR
jgi:peptidyl-prolyl cis-trans isomerase A (cyclophilin A)